MKRFMIEVLFIAFYCEHLPVTKIYYLHPVPMLIRDYNYRWGRVISYLKGVCGSHRMASAPSYGWFGSSCMASARYNLRVAGL